MPHDVPMPLEPKLHTPDHLRPVLSALSALEPLIYAANAGARRDHFERLLAPGFLGGGRLGPALQPRPCAGHLACAPAATLRASLAGQRSPRGASRAWPLPLHLHPGATHPHLSPCHLVARVGRRLADGLPPGHGGDAIA
jgi:hypothetical protein